MKKVLRENPLLIAMILLSVCSFLGTTVSAAICLAVIIFLFFVQSKWGKIRSSAFFKISKDFNLLDETMQNKISGLLEAILAASQKREKAQEYYSGTSNAYASKAREIEILKKELMEVSIQKESAKKEMEEANVLLVQADEEFTLIKNKIA